jgi:selenium metabolism protein YedF
MADSLTIDARGLVCPQPVLKTKEALDGESANHFHVLVDNPASKENVGRFARNQGCEVEIVDVAENEWRIEIARGNAGPVPKGAEEDLLPCPVPASRPAAHHVVYIGTNHMGRGDDVLGAKLMRGFLRTCIDTRPLPWRIIFINSGVYLATDDEEAVEAVGMLERNGVEILACGTCLQHFGLEDKLKVGRVTNMYEVIETLTNADKVISPD